jgi:peptidyl-prolyl cis-trans isomerase SurA
MDPMTKSLSECKGLVTADYQKHLEEEWIKELRTKYVVKVNEDVLAKVNK